MRVLSVGGVSDDRRATPVSRLRTPGRRLRDRACTSAQGAGRSTGVPAGWRVPGCTWPGQPRFPPPAGRRRARPACDGAIGVAGTSGRRREPCKSARSLVQKRPATRIGRQDRGCRTALSEKFGRPADTCYVSNLLFSKGPEMVTALEPPLTRLCACAPGGQYLAASFLGGRGRRNVKRET